MKRVPTEQINKGNKFPYSMEARVRKHCVEIKLNMYCITLRIKRIEQYSPSFTVLSGRGHDRPVTVDILLHFSGSNRLLSGPRSIFYIVRMQPHPIIRVQQLEDRATCDEFVVSGG